MKYKYEKNKHKFYITLTFLVILFASTYFSMVKFHIESKQSALEDYVKLLESERKITTGIYADMADLIYKTSIDNNDIKKLFADGVMSSDLEEQNKFRQQLYNQLSGLYTVLENYNFRQLHFHDKDNNSYLRFHRPETYGDNLTGIRYSVEYVNSEKESIAGFEEGRIFNGYRYVYPLSSQNKHIGSVEISISIKTIVEQIEKLSGQNAQFILLRSQMEQKVFDSEVNNYRPWKIDNRYVLDKGISESCSLENEISEDEMFRLRHLLDEFGPEGKPFATEIKYGEGKSVITFLPIKNFLNENVAYLISLSDNLKIKEIKQSFTILSILYISLFILIAVLIFYYTASRNKIEQIMQTDHLTKSDTRRVILEKIEREKNRFVRYKHPFSIIMLDIDHFKNINDNYGHLTGDEVLRDLTAVVQRSLRTTDSLGRYGGEEFIIILPETDLKSAYSVAEDIRKIIQDHQFFDSKSVTVSMGIAEAHDDISNVDDLIEKADKNLYKAKESGRNRVCF